MYQHKPAFLFEMLIQVFDVEPSSECAQEGNEDTCIKEAPWLSISFHQDFLAVDREKHNCGSVPQTGKNYTFNQFEVGKDL